MAKKSKRITKFELCGKAFTKALAAHQATLDAMRKARKAQEARVAPQLDRINRVTR
jgi:hypothetical protein